MISVVRYYVISSDGQRYGPADIPTLNQWAAEGRLLPQQMLEDEASGQRAPASSVSGINFPVAQQDSPTYAPGQPYQQHYARPAYGGDDGSQDVTQAWIYGVLGLFCCFLFDIPALMAANRAMQKGNPGANAARIFIFVVIGLQVVSIVIQGLLFATGMFR